MHERQAEVVERLQIDEPLVGRDVARERIRIERARFGGDLCSTVARDAPIDVSEAELPHVDEQVPHGRERHVFLEGAIERAFALDHLAVEELRLRVADLGGRSAEAHLEDLAALSLVALADARDVALHDRFSRREVRQLRRRETRRDRDGEVRDERHENEHRERDELLLVPPHEARLRLRLRRKGARRRRVGRRFVARRLSARRIAVAHHAVARRVMPRVRTSVPTTRRITRIGSRTLSKCVVRSSG